MTEEEVMRYFTYRESRIEKMVHALVFGTGLKLYGSYSDCEHIVDLAIDLVDIVDERQNGEDNDVS